MVLFLSFFYFIFTFDENLWSPSKSNSISKEKSRAKFEGNSKRLLPVADGSFFDYVKP